ncbi:MAG: flagellar basal-body rod protein FlgG [Tissierellia bacterium]|nr:flagellar basal-body rod protein FlgG [Tissierellia bacterium]
MRALWTAATGMRAQQLNIDTIANNLSNVNTTSYKSQRMEFKDLLYVTLKSNNRYDEEDSPTNLEVGHGVLPTATSRNFENGSLIETEGEFDVAIDGSGFFAVRIPNGDIRYTRDGSFKLSAEAGGSRLVTSEGYLVLDENDNQIFIRDGITDIIIDELGYIRGLDENQETVNIARLKLVNFTNPNGLLSTGSNLYSATAASGAEIPIAADQMESRIIQGYLEASNVKIVDEMVKMITAQRAYEINSKTIQTSDDMMQIVNNLKR